ncbi:MAG TPA: PAS domain S-box protein [Thermoanaerobaculia bacterium]|nr:PAS domain S-box protein [Thermoanaerobaculia bacterium]
MNRLTVAWSIASGVCAALAAAHLAVWASRRSKKRHLLFGIAALAASANALAELAMFTAQTAAAYTAAHRVSVATVGILVVSMVWYARVYTGDGRRWLAWSVTAAWGVVVAVDLIDPFGPIFGPIRVLRTTRTAWGDPFVLPVAPLHATRELLDVADVFLGLFLIDLLWTMWKRRDRRHLLAAALGIGAIITVGLIQVRMVAHGSLEMPPIGSFIYLAIVSIAGYPLTADVIRIAHMADRLRESEISLTESRRIAILAADEAQRAEEWFRRVFDASPSAMVLVDREGTIRLVNSRAESLFGYSLGELVGRPVEALVPDRFEHARHRRSWFEHPHDRSPVGRELYLLRKDGTEIPVEIGLSSVRSGDAAFVLASVVDITARRQSELELARQRNELAHLSRLTTIGELAGSLAHEINQPLTAILSNAQAAQRLIERTPPDLAEVADILHDIVESDKHAGEVIRRLRTMLRKEEEHFERLDMSETVQDALKLARSDLLNHGVTVETELAAGLPAIDGDRVQLLQVLLNLVLNGIDAVANEPPERRRIFFGTARAEGEESAVHVWVGDSGPGIPEGELDRIFDPFFTTKQTGMGLGLSVCRTIVTAHGGRISATNDSGRGATFHVVLPARARDLREEEVPAMSVG